METNSAGAGTTEQAGAKPSRALPGLWRLTGALCPASGPFAPLLFAGNLEQGITTLGELGYDAVEFSLSGPDEVDLGRVREQVAKYGLAVSSVATGRMYYEHGLSISSPEAEVRAAAVERLKAMVEVAKELGSALVVGGVRGTLPRDNSAQALRKEAVLCVRAVAEHAVPHGVTVLFEPINRYETNFANTVEQGLEVVEEAAVPNIRLLLDTFHMNIEEVSLADAFRLAGDKLGYVHLVDSNRRAPGCGHTDFATVLGTLRDMGYRGYLGMEILPWPDSSSAARLGLENTAALVRKAME